MIYKLLRAVEALEGRRMNLEIFIEREITAVLMHLLWLVSLLRCASHDARLLVVADTLLEEIRLASQRYRLHEVEWIGGVVVFLIAKSEQEAVGAELDVLLHQGRIHA